MKSRTIALDNLMDIINSDILKKPSVILIMLFVVPSIVYAQWDLTGTSLHFGPDPVVQTDDPDIILNETGNDDSHFGFRLHEGSVERGSLKFNPRDNDIQLTSFQDDLIFDAFDDFYFKINGSTKMTFSYEGRLGIGTTTPSTDLHILNSSDDAELRLQSDNSIRDKKIDFYNLSNKVGSIIHRGNTFAFLNTSSNGVLEFDADSDIYFETDGSDEKMRIKQDGKIGMGTDDPQSSLHLQSSTLTLMRIEGGLGGGIDLYNDKSFSNLEGSIRHNTQDMDMTNYDASGSLYLGAATVRRLTIDKDGNVGIGTNFSNPAFKLEVKGDVNVTGELTAASDGRLKENIHSLKNALDIVAQLNPVSYDFRADEFPGMELSDRKKMGLIAQEVEKILPNLVSQGGQMTSINGEVLDVKSVNYIEMIPLLIKSIQELQAEVERLKKK